MPRFDPDEPVRCAVCEREVPGRLITLHHLKPKSRGGEADARVPTCRTCHKHVHAAFANRELEEEYTTVQALRAAPRMAAFLAWVRRQKPDRTFGASLSADRPDAARRRKLAKRRR